MFEINTFLVNTRCVLIQNQNEKKKKLNAMSSDQSSTAMSIGADHDDSLIFYSSFAEEIINCVNDIAHNTESSISSHTGQFSREMVRDKNKEKRSNRSTSNKNPSKKRVLLKEDTGTDESVSFLAMIVKES